MTFAFLAWRLRDSEKINSTGARIQEPGVRSQDSGFRIQDSGSPGGFKFLPLACRGIPGF